VQAATGAFRVSAIAPLTSTEADDLLDAAQSTVVLLTDGTDWVALTEPDRGSLLAGTPTELATAWRNLDIALVDAGLIEGRWAAAGTVVLRHSTAAAIETASNRSGVTVLVRPTAAATVLALAARGVLMPRKSTFFVPKPRTGLVMRCFVDEADNPTPAG